MSGFFQYDAVRQEYILRNFANYRSNTNELGISAIFWWVVRTPHRYVCRFDGLRWCLFPVQARTMSSVDAIYRRHSSKIHRLRHEWPHQSLARRMFSGGRHRRHWRQQGLFFQFGHDRIFCNPKVPANIPYPAAIQRLFDDLLFHLWQPRAIQIFPLKALSTGLAPIALCAVFTMPIFHQIVTLTEGAINLNILFHHEFRYRYYKRNFFWSRSIFCRICQG